MQRLLCPVETLFVGQRSRAVVSCTVRGALDADLLATAFADLTARHPPLRCVIAAADVPESIHWSPAGRGAGFALQELDVPPRLAHHAAGTRTYADELNTPLPLGGPLVRAALLEGADSTATLVLSVDHAIADGHSAIALHHALWARYAQLLAGAGPEPYCTDWPVPVSELLPPCQEDEAVRHFEQLVAAARPLEMLPHDGAPVSIGTGRIEVARLLLDRTRTAALRRAAYAGGVSVQGLVAAALLATARQRLGGEGPRTLGCLSPVDLRTRLEPPLPAETMVAAVTFHTDVFDIAPGEDTFARARAVTDSLKRALADGEPFRTTRVMARVAQVPALMLGTVIATNMGAVDAPPLPSDLDLLDLRLVPAREQYHPEAGRSPVLACVTTFDGRLAVEFPYWTGCFSPAATAAFRDGVGTELCRLSAHGMR